MHTLHTQTSQGSLDKSTPSHMHSHVHTLYTHSILYLCTSQGHLTSLHIHTQAHYTQTSQGSLDKSMPSHMHTHTHTHIPSIHITFCYLHTSQESLSESTLLHMLSIHVMFYLRTSPRVSWQSVRPHTHTHTHTHTLTHTCTLYTHSIKLYGDGLNDITSISLY